MSDYVIAVYMSFSSWHVHGSHSVCLPWRHVRSLLHAPHVFHDVDRTSRLVWPRRYSHVGGRCPKALGTPPLGSTGACRCSPSGSESCDHCATDLGTAATTPDRGTVATAHQGWGAAATGRGYATARALGQLPPSPAPGWVPSLMNRDGAWKIEP
jgi:hypothetical protein